VLSILVWWAIPAVAVTLAAAVAAVTRRIRHAREDVGTLQRYQRAREVLERTQQRPVAPVPKSHPDLPSSP
jgi:cytochrome c-type biogenesis protein CcmH/NrfF